MYFQIVSDLSKSYDKVVSLLSEDNLLLSDCLSEEQKEFTKKIWEKNKFTGKTGQSCEVSLSVNSEVFSTLYIGLGKKEEYSKNNLRDALYTALKKEEGKILLTSEDNNLIDLSVFVEIAEHINYSFEKYKSKKKEGFLYLDYYSKEEVEFPQESAVLAEISSKVRNFINEPAAYMTPERLSLEAQTMAEKYGFQIEVLDEHKADRLRMKAFLAVGQASLNRPKVIVMRHLGNPESDKKIALIGKGVCYDTGGLSLKPTSGMLNMKDDMSGAATVIGIISALAAMKVKQNVVAVIAACENSIGSKAYRPGDVIGTMKGTTIEVTNTDAEGRLTLADALTYSVQVEKADELIDLATLTGAIVMALGSEATGVFTNQKNLFTELEAASADFKENFWQMPIFPSHKKAITSKIADLKNTGSREAGASFAASFLEEFVEGKPWLHLDIAGVAFLENGNSYYPSGATGETLRSVYTYIKHRKL